MARPDAPRNLEGQKKRFDVYRNNVFATAVDALAESFPAVARLVGEEFFRATARAFLDNHPPRSPILALIGGGFAEFLDGFPPAGSVPYLGDVARLEFAMIEAHHAADADPMTIDRLAAIPMEDLEAVALTPHPSLSLIRSRFSVGSIWEATTEATSAANISMTQAQDVMVLRPNLGVETAVLPPGGGTFLGTLLHGGAISVAAEKAAGEVADFDLSIHLSGLFAAGAFVAATTGTG